MDYSTLIGIPSSTSHAKTAGGKKKRLRKCPQELLVKAWEYFWDEDFKERAFSYRKMQWTFLKELLMEDAELAPYAKKIAAAFLYIFACFSAANPGVPIFLLIYGIPDGEEHYEKRLNLLKELQAAPRLVRKTCKFVWKDKPSVPESIEGFGGYGRIVWKEQLMKAEIEAIQTMLGYYKNRLPPNEEEASISEEFLQSLMIPVQEQPPTDFVPKVQEN
jgi:hypothetical protein